jgi:hypothetical protein
LHLPGCGPDKAPLNLPPLSTYISKDELNLLKRYFRVDMISPNDLDDLSSKLGDPTYLKQDKLLLKVIRRLLYSSTATIKSPKVDSESVRIDANL